MLRVLRQKRWIGFSLFTIFMLVLFVRLGLWQFGKLKVRRDSNAVIIANQAAKPAGYQDIVAAIGPGRKIGAGLEWRTVEVTGHWDYAHQVLLRNRTYNSVDGYEVITPLEPASGPALLVNRGWIAQGASSVAPASPAVPQQGIVTATVWLRQSQPPHSSASLPQGQVLAINALAIGNAVPYPLVDGYAILADEVPTPAATNMPTLLPAVTIDDGPYLSYGIQWFLFTGVAVVGWWTFIRKEADESTDDDGVIRDRSTQLPDSVRMG